jgi:UDP-N-acetylglucosamine 2-epimerase (non-hydrolysing)
MAAREPDQPGRVLTVVGARPQFVKLGPLSRALRRRVDEVVVHTGQHYDREMSEAFFDELALPRPDLHLGIGSGPHGRMTGRMMEALEGAMGEIAPALVLVLGDTNSTLAGALAAAKLGVPVAHVEAGLRSFDGRMPEEINRRLTDHASQLLFCPTPRSVANLRAEGIRRGVHRTGDVTVDAVRAHLPRAMRGPRMAGTEPGAYYVATLHRQENVDDGDRLASLAAALGSLPRPVVFAVHPRTRRRMAALGLRVHANVRLVPPQPYLAMLRLVKEARAVLTDSGGLQKEAFILGTPCVTLRDSTEWTESVDSGANVLATRPRRIRAALARFEERRPRWRAAAVYGDGRAAERIAAIVARFIAGRR